MATTQACCICSSLLDTYDSKTEKPIIAARYLPCCTRAICQRCIASNPRYKAYCPYCQISTEPSPLPQGLRDPPPYDSNSVRDGNAIDSVDEKRHISDNDHDDDAEPPSYSTITNPSTAPLEKPSSSSTPPQDVLHFLTPQDTLLSLSLAYKVPLDALRRSNNIFADHLLQGRRTLLIPAEYYKGGVSLSPRPVEGEEEELRRSKVRRWMVRCKVSEYDVALLYLEQADYDLEAAVEAYKEDERWEKEHPLDHVGGSGKKNNKKSAGLMGMTRFVGASSAASSAAAAAAAAAASSSSASGRGR
ncbi:hypothetical protein AAFC00_003067 [Neodothiora populina]|uniref:LysM domain-containing protein n=1 Tax=Neodothiora populina TaxID=2781224 RepID=A0ABR3P9H0_9PEZI